MQLCLPRNSEPVSLELPAKNSHKIVQNAHKKLDYGSKQRQLLHICSPEGCVFFIFHIPIYSATSREGSRVCISMAKYTNTRSCRLFSPRGPGCLSKITEAATNPLRKVGIANYTNNWLLACMQVRQRTMTTKLTSVSIINLGFPHALHLHCPVAHSGRLLHRDLNSVSSSVSISVQIE